MPRKPIQNPAYHQWAAEVYEREKGQPTFPAREVLRELGYDLDALIERRRKKRTRRAARKTPGRRR